MLQDTVWFVSNPHSKEDIEGLEKVPSENVKNSDMLPSGWNNEDNYALVYQSSSGAKSSIILLKVVNFDGLMLVHILRPSDDKSVAIEIQASEFTTENLSSFESAYKNIDILQQRLKVELLAPLQQTSEKLASSVQERITVDPLRVSSCRPSRPSEASWGPRRDPFGFGNSDLDLLQSGYGGGMIFDPMHSSGGSIPRFGGEFGRSGGAYLPGGAVIPGSRFDPFGPPDLDLSGNLRNSRTSTYRSTDPDPDHMRPPGFDDMFM